MGGSPKDPEMSAAEKEQVNVSALQFNHYIDTYKGAEIQLFEQMKRSEGDEASFRGGVAGEVHAQAAGLQRAKEQAELQSGANKSSNRSTFSKASLAASAGKAAGQAVGTTVLSEREQELDAMTKMSAFGRDLADNSSLSMIKRAENHRQRAVAEMQAENIAAQSKAEAAGAILGAVTFAEGGLLDKAKAWSSRRGIRARYATRFKADTSTYNLSPGKQINIDPLMEPAKAKGYMAQSVLIK